MLHMLWLWHIYMHTLYISLNATMIDAQTRLSFLGDVLLNILVYTRMNVVYKYHEEYVGNYILRHILCEKTHPLVLNTLE